MANLADYLTDDQIRRALFDLQAIDRAGMMRDLKDELNFVRREYHDRRLNRTAGEDLDADMLAGDLARLLGVDREDVRRVARQRTSWSATAINVVARVAADARQGVRR